MQNQDSVAFEYPSIDTYRALAKKIVTHFAKRHAFMILSDDQMFGEVITELMKADWLWDSTRGRSRNSYRIQRGRWALQNLLKKRGRQAKHSMLSVETDVGREFIPDRKFHWKDETASRRESAINTCRALLRNTVLTESQSEAIRLYYFDGLNIPQIATRLNVSNQNVQQVLSTGRRRLKEMVA